MIFSKTIINWYSVNKRNLPWRTTTNPYYIWLSEIILQQTQVSQGLPYYEAFVRQFPTVFDLANAKEETVLNLWQGLGYYSRARNLHTSAKYIVNQLNGEFPSTYKTIKELKGVGDYTASAIASICFKEPTAVVDGNVYRVLSRVFNIETPINSTKGIKEFKHLAQELIDVSQPDTFNQAIMDFGSQVCKPKQPLCDSCVFNSSCKALQLKKINELPVKLKKVKVRKKHFNFLVFLNPNNETILEKRVGKGIWQNMYQFPLFESETEVGNDIITNYIKDNYNFGIEDIRIYNETPIIHKLSHQHLHTKFWIITTSNNFENGTSIKQINDFPVPVLISNFINDFGF